MLLKTSGDSGGLSRKGSFESDERGYVLRKGSAEGWTVRASCSRTSTLSDVLGRAG